MTTGARQKNAGDASVDSEHLRLHPPSFPSFANPASFAVNVQRVGTTIVRGDANAGTRGGILVPARTTRTTRSRVTDATACMSADQATLGRWTWWPRSTSKSSAGGGEATNPSCHSAGRGKQTWPDTLNPRGGEVGGGHANLFGSHHLRKGMNIVILGAVSRRPSVVLPHPGWGPVAPKPVKSPVGWGRGAGAGQVFKRRIWPAVGVRRSRG